MSLICPQCGAENRDSAKFCLKCAHQLVPLGAATEPPAEPRKRRRKRRPVAQDQPARRRQMLLWGVVLVGALIGMGILIGRWGAQPAVPGATTASASAAARQAPASANPPTTLAQAATAPTSAPESAALMRAAEALQQLHTQASAPTPHASATVT
ncbi:MAG: zinc ribbon domain-containing protein, partial [Proteobacteria bacterium]|nr:zinc ribbon domain-containing protein [Pseudomonadota bacterium]